MPRVGTVLSAECRASGSADWSHGDREHGHLCHCSLESSLGQPGSLSLILESLAVSPGVGLAPCRLHSGCDTGWHTVTAMELTIMPILQIKKWDSARLTWPVPGGAGSKLPAAGPSAASHVWVIWGGVGKSPSSCAQQEVVRGA